MKTILRLRSNLLLSLFTCFTLLPIANAKPIVPPRPQLKARTAALQFLSYKEFQSLSAAQKKFVLHRMQQTVLAWYDLQTRSGVKYQTLDPKAANKKSKSAFLNLDELSRLLFSDAVAARDGSVPILGQAKNGDPCFYPGGHPSFYNDKLVCQLPISGGAIVQNANCSLGDSKVKCHPLFDSTICANRNNWQSECKADPKPEMVQEFFKSNSSDRAYVFETFNSSFTQACSGSVVGTASSYCQVAKSQLESVRSVLSLPSEPARTPAGSGVAEGLGVVTPDQAVEVQQVRDPGSVSAANSAAQPPTSIQRSSVPPETPPQAEPVSSPVVSSEALVSAAAAPANPVEPPGEPAVSPPAPSSPTDSSVDTAARPVRPPGRCYTPPKMEWQEINGCDVNQLLALTVLPPREAMNAKLEDDKTVLDLNTARQLACGLGVTDMNSLQTVVQKKLQLLEQKENLAKKLPQPDGCFYTEYISYLRGNLKQCLDASVRRQGRTAGTGNAAVQDANLVIRFEGETALVSGKLKVPFGDIQPPKNLEIAVSPFNLGFTLSQFQANICQATLVGSVKYLDTYSSDISDPSPSAPAPPSTGFKKSR